MRAAWNDFLRAAMGWGMVAFGGLLTLRHRLRLRSFLKRQARLRRRYAICSEEPILPYGAQMEKSIRQAASRIPAPHYYAVTSGSTAEPKRTLYSRARLRSVKWTFSEVFLRMVHHSPIRRKSLYVFSSLQQEGESLTGLMLRERGDVSFFSTLQAPYHIHRHPDLQQLTELYGDAALRLWVLALANPGLLYSTNPSTIAYFLDRLAHDWTASSSLVRDFHDRPADFAPRVLKLARRLESRGARAPLQAIACASRPMSFSECAPGVEAYICWTGGYVKPFLERIETYLPRAQYLRVPMYSNVTETIVVTAEAATISTDIQSQTTYEKSMIEELAITREASKTQQCLAPGVHATGPQSDSSINGAAISISGSQTYENLFLVNGVVVNENTRGQAIEFIIEDAVQETTISTSGVSAEFGRFNGGVVNVITKSGGNEFHGSFRDNVSKEAWEGQ